MILSGPRVRPEAYALGALLGRRGRRADGRHRLPALLRALDLHVLGRVVGPDDERGGQHLRGERLPHRVDLEPRAEPLGHAERRVVAAGPTPPYATTPRGAHPYPENRADQNARGENHMPVPGPFARPRHGGGPATP